MNKLKTIVSSVCAALLCTGTANAQNFTQVPADDISAADDLKQMMWQMGYETPVATDRQTFYNTTLLPKLKAFGSDVTMCPSDSTKPEGNWTWATGTSTTWLHENGVGDTLTGRVTVARVNDGFWHNYIQAWEPGGDYFTGAKFYKPLALHDLSGLTPADWLQRRNQLLEGVQDIYGKIPAAAANMQITWSVKTREVLVSDPGFDWSCRCMTEGGKTLEHPFREYAITGDIVNPSGYTARNTPQIVGKLRVPLNLPAGKTLPVIIIFGTYDETLWTAMAPENIAVCYFDNSLLQPDKGGEALYSYLMGLVGEGNWRKPEDWGTLAAWSWGVSRLIDFFETHIGETPVNPKYIGLTGHSRYGKATLVTMAYDTRVTFSFPSSSGALGSSQNRRHWGEEMVNVAADPYAYYWVCGKLLKYVGLHPSSTDGYMPRKVMDLPADAESLVALCAPRPIFLGTGRPEAGDSWVDPYGTYLTAIAASPVYEFLGKKGLIMDDTFDYNGKAIPMPVIDKPYIEGDIGYRIHNQGHIATPHYPSFIEFIRRQFGNFDN